MKILLAICFGVCFHAMAWQNAGPMQEAFVNSPNPALLLEETCTLTITGYATYEGYGRAVIAMISEAETCEKAAADLRKEIIKREIRIEK